MMKDGGAKLSQTQKVLRHLKEYGSINPATAYMDYGIYRLGARIKDLRDKGYPITTKIVNGLNKFGEPCHWAEYRLEKGAA